MRRFRGTDISLGLLAVAVNVGLVVGVVAFTTGRPDVEEPPSAQPTTTSTPSTPRTTTSTTTSVAVSPAALLTSNRDVTLAVLGDGTSDGEGEWVAVFAQLLAQDRQVRLHGLNPQDPTQYSRHQDFGGSGPRATVYNGSRAGTSAGYAAKRLPFLVPKKPDFVILNYGRDNTADNVKRQLTTTAGAIRGKWPNAPLLVTLQPPSLDDADREVRAAVAAWAKASRVKTLDVAEVFLKADNYNAYVSGADPDAMNSEGDRLWGETVFTLLGGELPAPATSEPTSTDAAVTTPPAGGPQPVTNGPAPSPSPSSTSSAPESTTPAPTTTTEPSPPPILESPSATPTREKTVVVGGNG